MLRLWVLFLFRHVFFELFFQMMILLVVTNNFIFRHSYSGITVCEKNYAFLYIFLNVNEVCNTELQLNRFNDQYLRGNSGR